VPTDSHAFFPRCRGKGTNFSSEAFVSPRWRFRALCGAARRLPGSICSGKDCIFKHMHDANRQRLMEKSLLPTSRPWHDRQQMLFALVRRAVQNASGKMAGHKSYPSHRPCPVCDGKTVYQGSWGTFFTGLYTRTCSACGYCDPKKVKMIKQL